MTPERILRALAIDGADEKANDVELQSTVAAAHNTTGAPSAVAEFHRLPLL
ncbi:MAG TPA: hypothetical protein VJ790_07890 [Dongiaceae bacterium]|nr:hypothetical protein [Dongiaceae bacterium]